MAKKSVTELDFDFADDGELELKGFDDGDEFIEEDELLEEEEEEVEEEEEEEEVEEESSVVVRLSNLEKTMQSLPQMIATSIASALNKTTALKEDEEEEIPEELDNKQIVNILAKRMQKSVKETVNSAVKEMHESDPAIREARITAEFRHCRDKYGQKFVDRAESVAKIMYGTEKAGGRISAEDAYLSIANVPVRGSKTNQGQKTVPTKKPVRVDADSRDAVGSVDREVRPKFDSKKMKETTDADYFQQSWNSGLMSAVRDARRGRRSA